MNFRVWPVALNSRITNKFSFIGSSGNDFIALFLPKLLDAESSFFRAKVGVNLSEDAFFLTPDPFSGVVKWDEGVEGVRGGLRGDDVTEVSGVVSDNSNSSSARRRIRC